ncbi:MAG: hypothetical protein IPO47_04875 [Bacteroidetes bacterium]|nr:hypothetical protein [Bacteroidota bacterium]
MNILSNSYTEKERDTKLDYKFDDLTLFNISYLIYYYGIGENSDIILIPSLRRFASSEFINYLRKQIGELKNQFELR